MGLLSQKLRSGVLELATETGPLYVAPTLLERAYLLWTFRNFPRLSRLVLNDRQRELIDKLCRASNLRHHLPADVPILGVIENVTLASQRKSVASAASVVTINSTEAQVAQVVGASLKNALARVQGRHPVPGVRAAHEGVTAVRKDKKNSAQSISMASPTLVKPAPKWGMREQRPKWLTPAVALSAAVLLLAGFIYLRPNRPGPETFRLRLDQSYAPVQMPLTATAEKPTSRGVAEVLPKPSAARAVGQPSTAAVPLRSTPRTLPATSTMNKSATPAAVLPFSTYAPTSRVERPSQPTAIAAPPPEVAPSSGVARETSVNNPPAVARIVINAAPVTFGYPVAPKATLLGKVHLRIVIGSDGTVKDVSALSGNPELADAAVKAVRRWKYRPPLMNGQAVEAETNVTINFAGDDAVTIAYR